MEILKDERGVVCLRKCGWGVCGKWRMIVDI